MQRPWIFAFEVLPLTPGIGVRSCALIEQFALSHNLRAGDAIIAATAIENDIMLSLHDERQALSADSHAVAFPAESRMMKKLL